MENIKVVTMGGGTGTFPVVSALKTLKVDISAIVSVSDSGGSTGRIRDEFGFQPVGDLRQSLAALADTKSQQWIQKLLLYRFAKGEGLRGHNLGNLILTALQDMSGNTTQALEIAEQIFNLDGSVIPVTSSYVDLKIHFSDGSLAIGEHLLDNQVSIPIKIDNVSLIPECPINPPAKKALLNADYIIIGPGDLYASIMSTLVVDDIKEIFKQANGKIIFMSNLMTRKTQTHNMTAQQHLQVVERAIGKKVDTIIINNQPIPQPVLQQYALEDEFPVKDDLTQDSRVFRTHLLLDTLITKTKFDTAHRSLLRHDAKKLEKAFLKIIKGQKS
jgi:uncharacterized cofD-like protein